MIMIYDGAAVMGTPKELVELLRTWRGYSATQKRGAYKRGVRRRAKILYGKTISIYPDKAFLEALNELGELKITKR